MGRIAIWRGVTLSALALQLTSQASMRKTFGIERGSFLHHFDSGGAHHLARLGVLDGQALVRPVDGEDPGAGADIEVQFPSQIRGSKARSSLEALPNQLLFPNGEAASADYDGFRLTDGELDFVLSPIPGQRMVLSRTPRSSTVLNVDL